MKLNGREIFHETKGEGVLTHGVSFYTQREGPAKMRFISTEIRSDTLDTVERSFSQDNGRTWSRPQSLEFIFKTPEGVRRRYLTTGFVDGVNGRMFMLVLEGVLPTDDPLEGMKTWYLRYRVSLDGGKTDAVDEQIIQKGNYTSQHPCEGVWIGKNSIMIGDLGSYPIRTRAGRVLVPVQTTPIGPDGEYYNPGGGYTYHEAAVLIGAWIDGHRLEWDLSQSVANDPAKSTRGCVEPTLAEMPDGRILMVLRGSNDVKGDLPGCKWYSVSTDGGFTWDAVRPWTYTDGSNFFSPSSCSQLLHHSNGRYYWLGNLTSQNPKGNRPRYPFVIGEVDPKSLLLVRDSVMIVDDRRPEDDPEMTLSNFFAHEDRRTGEIIINMSRPFTRGQGDWASHAYLYRIAP